jgi:hypothetical protein
MDALLVALAFVVAAAFARSFVGGERFFYYWDFAAYQDIALRTADTFRTLGLVDAFYTVYLSTADDYNAIFAIPLLPFLSLLGETRVTYILGLTLLYQVPFLLALGGIAAKLVPSSSRAVFWCTVVVGFVTPMAWVPTLRGFPDVGAAALIALATRLYVEDPHVIRRSHVAVIGVLLALAILFRRHFLFAVIAFLVAMVLLALVRVSGRAAGRDARDAARELARGLARIGFVGTVTCATLAVFGHHFLMRIWTHDFATLYTGYQVPPSQVLVWYVKPYGVAVCLAACIGFVFAVRGRIVDRAATTFVAVFSVVLVVMWLVMVRQLGEQYTLHFTPPIVLGCSLLVWSLTRAASHLVGPPALLTTTACLLCNLFFGLSAHPKVYHPSPFRAAFAANWPPLRRTDYDDMRRLIESLQERAGPDETVLVAASSHTINPDLLAHAAQSQFGRAGSLLKVLRTPALDSGDVYPLELLLQADYVVLVHPFQHHLQPEEQRVVKVVLDLFDEGRDFAQDFEPLPGVYRLEDEAVATVRRRIRPTSDAVALRTLRYVREGVRRKPGMQSDWMVLSELYPSLTRRAGPDSWTLLTHPTKRNEMPEARWLYIHETEDDVRVTGRVHMIYGVCPGITLAFFAADEAGSVTPLGEVSRRQEDDGAFALDLKPGRGRWLVLRAMSPPWRDSIHACLTWLEDVRVTDATP